MAEGLVRDVLARVINANHDLTATHVITRMALFGSMTDPSRDLLSDADLAVWADRRSDVPLGAEPELRLEGEAHHVAENLAARDRSELEALHAADDERIAECSTTREKLRALLSELQDLTLEILEEGSAQES